MMRANFFGEEISPFEGYFVANSNATTPIILQLVWDYTENKIFLIHVSTTFTVYGEKASFEPYSDITTEHFEIMFGKENGLDRFCFVSSPYSDKYHYNFIDLINTRTYTGYNRDVYAKEIVDIDSPKNWLINSTDEERLTLDIDFLFWKKEANKYIPTEELERLEKEVLKSKLSVLEKREIKRQVLKVEGSILSLCSKANEDLNDAYFSDTLNSNIEYLDYVLETWEEGHLNSKGYDNSIKELIQQTINKYYESYKELS